jgi:hypothetical protein
MGKGAGAPPLLQGSSKARLYCVALHQAPAADLKPYCLCVILSCLHVICASKPLSAGSAQARGVGRQAADLGVGIMGKEGRQAVNNSDFAISQFRRAARSAHGRTGRAGSARRAARKLHTHLLPGAAVAPAGLPRHPMQHCMSRARALRGMTEHDALRTGLPAQQAACSSCPARHLRLQPPRRHGSPGARARGESGQPGGCARVSRPAARAAAA